MKKFICFIVAAIVVSSISLFLSQKTQASSSIIDELRKSDISAVSQENDLILVDVCRYLGTVIDNPNAPFWHKCVGSYPDVQDKGITVECKAVNGFSTMVPPTQCYLTPR